MNLVLDARIKFYRTDIRVQTELLSIENHLSEPCQLWFGIRLARLRENRFAVHLVSNCTEHDCVGRFALFKRPVGPFGFVLGVIVAATRNLFDLKINLKYLAYGAQDFEGARQNLGPDSI